MSFNEAARETDEPIRTLSRAAAVFFRFPSPRFLAFLYVHMLHFEPRRIFGWLVDPFPSRMHRAHSAHGRSPGA